MSATCVTTHSPFLSPSNRAPTMKTPTNIKDFLVTRPLSWSALSSFDYSPEQWYKRYILNEKDPPSAAMEFGKITGERIAEDPTFLPNLPRLGNYEYELRTTFRDIPLVGFIDDYLPHTHLSEFKTGVKKWDQKRADGHHQITMYLLMLSLIHKVRPEDIPATLYWFPTEEKGDFTVGFTTPDPTPLAFPTSRTTLDTLYFGQRIVDTVQKMQEYVDSKQV